jgi:hypothetical protein
MSTRQAGIEKNDAALHGHRTPATGALIFLFLIMSGPANLAPNNLAESRETQGAMNGETG